MVLITTTTKVTTPGEESPPPSPRSAPPSQQTQSTLSSLGSSVGYGFLKCLSFAALKTYFFLARCMGKDEENPEYDAPVHDDQNYDLSDYDEMYECFEKDPAKGIHRILDLLDDEESKIDEVFKNLVKYFREGGRKGPIGRVDDLLFGLLASSQVLFHAYAYINAEYEHGLITALQADDDEWGSSPQTAQARKVRELEAESKRVKAQCEGVWKACFEGIEMMTDGNNDDDESLLAPLKLDNHDVFAGNGRPKITFGHFVERLNFQVGWITLISPARFNPLMRGVLQTLGYLIDIRNDLLSQHPALKGVVTKAQRVLNKPEVKDRLFRLLNTNIHESSPKKRRPSDAR